jgi:hypothetical protein
MKNHPCEAWGAGLLQVASMMQDSTAYFGLFKTKY